MRQATVIHILTNISRSTSNQVMQFHHLIRKTWEIFFMKGYTYNVVDKLFREPLPENQNWVYLWINCLKYDRVRFYYVPSCLLSKYIKLDWKSLIFRSYKESFQKRKRVLELVSPLHFRHDFLRKIFLLLCSITWPNFIVWMPLLCKIFDNMCTGIVC